MGQVIAAPHVNLKTWQITQRYFAFFVNNGSIYLNSSVDGGASWTWRSLGGPPTGIGSRCSVTAFPAVHKDGACIWHFYVFVTAPTDPSAINPYPNELWVNVSLDDGNTWKWQSQGAPPNDVLSGFPSPDPEVVSRQSVNPPFETDVYCHLIGGDGHLYVNYSEDNGQTWQWADRGSPPGTGLSWNGPQSSIAYLDSTRQSVYYFAVGSDHNMYANYGDGTTWTWLCLGQPQGVPLAFSGAHSSGMSSLTYLKEVTKAGRIFSFGEAIWVFVVGGGGDFANPSPFELYACYSPAGGAGWQWETLGSPSGIATLCPTALLVSSESNSAVFTQNVFLFAVGDDLNAYADFTSDASRGSVTVWKWLPCGLPPDKPILNFRGAVASTEIEASLASVQMFVFAIDLVNEVRTYRWDGSSWAWYDQQGP